MIEDNDFIIRGEVQDGYTIVREMSCGFAPLLVRDAAYWMMSKTGDRESFYFPKGHVQIVDGFPETPIETADRETREEMFLDETIEFLLNGFIGSLKEAQDFEKSKERSFKTIIYLGANVDTSNTDLILPNDRLVRAISLDDVSRYAKPELNEVIFNYASFLGL